MFSNYSRTVFLWNYSKKRIINLSTTKYPPAQHQEPQHIGNQIFMIIKKKVENPLRTILSNPIRLISSSRILRIWTDLCIFHDRENKWVDRLLFGVKVKLHVNFCLLNYYFSVFAWIHFIYETYWYMYNVLMICY